MGATAAYASSTLAIYISPPHFLVLLKEGELAMPLSLKQAAMPDTWVLVVLNDVSLRFLSDIFAAELEIREQFKEPFTTRSKAEILEEALKEIGENYAP